MQRIAAPIALLLLSLSLAGCEVIEGIFKVGFWLGIIVILLIIALIWFIIRMMR